MAKLSKLFATDKTKETGGVWIKNIGGLDLLIGRSGTPEYENTLRKLGKPHLRQLRSGTIDADLAKTVEEMQIKALAEHCLLGWQHLEDDNGQPIEYSRAKAAELMLQHRDFYRQVLELAADIDNFRVETLEESRGNSLPASSGTSTGVSTQKS